MLEAGRRVHVSDFAHLRPRARPAVTCPECHDEVILALGKIRRHHARHRPGSQCPATQPETALHLNTKYYLADVLTRAAGSGEPLRVRRHCVVGNRPYISGGDVTWIESTSNSCARYDDVVLVDAWDDVQVESRVADQGMHRIPDIVLRREGQPVGAVEVLVSHEVDDDKAAMFAELGVPWVEVEASDALSDRLHGWTIARPLAARASSVPLTWRCDAHRATESARPAIAGSVAEQSPPWEVDRAARVVDFYLANGVSRRMVYRVRITRADGALVRATLDRNGELVRQYHPAAGEAEAAFLSRVNPVIARDCDGDIARLSRRVALVDSGHWLKGNALGALAQVQRRYGFNPVDREWKLLPTDRTHNTLEKIASAARRRRSSVQRSLENGQE